MKKILLTILSLAATSVFAADFVQDTKNYAFSSVVFGYYEHFCNHEGSFEKNHEGAIRLPLAKYGKIGLDAFTKFGDGGTDLGAVFPVEINSWLEAQPMIFNNFGAKDVGVGLTFAVDLRRFRPW